MSFLSSDTWKQYFEKRNTKILLLGIDDTGKKTIFRQLQLFDQIRYDQLIGFQGMIFEYKGFNITSWDYTADDRIRAYWRRKYFSDIKGIIYVVDSSNSMRLEYSVYELHEILKEEKIKDSILLIFLNKQDQKNSIDSDEFEKKLNKELIENRTFKIQKSIATIGEGIYEGLNWIGESINNKFRPK